MKKLYLVRHAKSSWKDPKLADYDRPLNKRGKRDAPFMAKKMRLRGVLPDLMISSGALRAKKTAYQFAEGLSYPKGKVQIRREVYDADEQDLLQIIQGTKSSYDSLMLFGHNPEFTWFANELANTGIENVPTTGIVAINLEIEHWKDAGFGKGRLLFFDYPKNYLSELPEL